MLLVVTIRREKFKSECMYVSLRYVYCSIWIRFEKLNWRILLFVCLIQIENSNQFMFQIFIKQSKYFDGSGFGAAATNSSWHVTGRARKSEWTEKSFNIEPKIISSINNKQRYKQKNPVRSMTHSMCTLICALFFHRLA